MKTIQEIASTVCSLYSDMNLAAGVSAEHGAIWSCEIFVDDTQMFGPRVKSVVLVEEQPTAEQAANMAYDEWLKWCEENEW